MVDNRYATALVIGSVLSLLATVYLSVAVGTQHWYQYRIRPSPSNNAANTSELVKDFINGDFNEKNYSETMFRLNGTLGLWWRCIMVPSETHWYKEPSMWSFSFVPYFCSLVYITTGTWKNVLFLVEFMPLVFFQILKWRVSV